jgi:AraC-like DNA-binding protein
VANEVEIVVTSSDRTGGAFRSAVAGARQASTNMGRAISQGAQSGFASLVQSARSSAEAVHRTLVSRGKHTGKAVATAVAEGMRENSSAVAVAADRISRDASDKLGNDSSAKRAGYKFGAGFVGSFRGTIVSGLGRAAALGSGAVATALVLLPGLAGIIGGSVGTAFGAGLATIGFAAAAQTQKVRGEFEDLRHTAIEGFRQIGGPLEDSLVHGLEELSRVGAGLRPSLTAAFQEIGQSATGFFTKVADGLISLGPSLADLGRSFGDVLDALGDRAPEIFEDIGSGLSTFAELATEHADDIAGAFKFISQTFESTADGLQWFSEQFGFTEEEMANFHRQMIESRGGVEAFRAEMAKFPHGAADAEKIIELAGYKVKDMGVAARETAASVSDLAAELEDLNSGAIDIDKARIKYEEAFDKINAQIKDGARDLRFNTEEGRANRKELIKMAENANVIIGSMAAQHAGLGELTAQYQTFRGEMIATARNAGLSERAAKRLVDRLFGVPKSIQTFIDAKTQQAEANIQRVRNLMASFGSKTVYLTVQQVLRSVPGVSLRQLMNAHGGNIGGTGSVKRFATGGVSGSGSAMAVVGEEGPELVRLPLGATVIPAGQSASMMSARAASSIGFSFRSSSRSSEMSELSKSIKDLTKELRDIITLREGMSKFTDDVMGQGRAFIAYEAALDRAAASVKKNGRTLNINREKGRENRSALLDLAQAAHEATFAMHELGRPASSIIARMKEQRAEFIKVARTMGLTTKQAKDLADKWGLLPSTVKSVLAKEARDKAYNKAAEAFNKSLEKKATGGPTSGWALVGERGPELVRLPGGSSVIPNGQSMSMMGGMQQPQPVVLELRSSGNKLDDLLLEILRRAVRVRGGDVQVVVGRR